MLMPPSVWLAEVSVILIMSEGGVARSQACNV